MNSEVLQRLPCFHAGWSRCMLWISTHIKQCLLFEYPWVQVWDGWVELAWLQRSDLPCGAEAQSKMVPVNQNSRKELFGGIFVFCLLFTDLFGVVSWWQFLMERGSYFSALQRLWWAVIAQQKSRRLALRCAEESAECGQLLKKRTVLASAQKVTPRLVNCPPLKVMKHRTFTLPGTKIYYCKTVLNYESYI